MAGNRLSIPLLSLVVLTACATRGVDHAHSAMDVPQVVAEASPTESAAAETPESTSREHADRAKNVFDVDPDEPVYSESAEMAPASPALIVLVSERRKNYVAMPVFFATDRRLITNRDGTVGFGPQRGILSYGVCEVSIPRDHRIGVLETPSIWKLEFSENPEKHVVLLSTTVRSPDLFYQAVAQRVRLSKRKSAFVFVHGYNVTFEDAARRTAQMSYDLGFDGAPVFYSWPSQGVTHRYTVDEQNVEWAQANLRQFLGDFFARSGSTDVYLVAHSMGNRALTGALKTLLAERPTLKSRLKEIILTAPDIDAEVFRRDIAPALASNGRPVTLYASADDKALMLSKQVHGYPRAGDAGDGLVIVPGVETIDATGMDAGFLGHSYYGDNRSVISDIYYVMRDGKRANDRFGLVPRDISRGRYWVFKK